MRGVLRLFATGTPGILILLGFWGLFPRLSAKSQESPDGYPAFDEKAGFYVRPFLLTLTNGGRAGQLYFTTNGSSPTRSSGMPYSGPLRISGTTVVRAALIPDKEDFPPVTRTCTYLFPDQVIRQTGRDFPLSWGTNAEATVKADYEMDPEIVGDPRYAGSMVSALKALPILSLVLDEKDLFDPQLGIYSNPRETGMEWERPASLEFLDPRGSNHFQVNCGVRIQGGWNRRPEESPKHSFRLVFRKRYGESSLKFPLFGPEAPTEFTTLILRAGCNNTWLHWSGEERRRGEMIRDQWIRDSQRALGWPASRGFFAHLYLNGLYWGIYNPSERPDAAFAASHLGGKPGDYDARNGDKTLEGDDASWMEMFARLNQDVSTPEAHAWLSRRLDLPQFADFMIVNLFGANGDWDRGSNWYAARHRRPGGLWQFYCWDGERTLEGTNDDAMATDDDQSPTRIFQRLRENPAFRKLFGERARMHLIGAGMLSVESNIARYRRYAVELDLPIIAESARWGDYRRDAHSYKTGPFELYTRDDHWRPEVKRLIESYFPNRAAVVIRQLRQAGLWADGQ